MPRMASPYETLLNATIDHLEQLRNSGQRHVAVDPALLEQLTRPAAPRPRSPGLTPNRNPGASARPTTTRADPDTAATPPITTPDNQPRPQDPSRPQPAPALPGMAPAPAEDPGGSGPARPALSPEAREAEMTHLHARAMVCQKCPHLVAVRHHVVFGVGDINASLMFVGEAPGMDEDLKGEPFVGKAGQLLTRIIQTMGFTRETVYIANILKCRPDTPGQSTGNRKPTLEEMATCKPYVEEQIDLIQPAVLVALGATAVTGLLGITTGITRLRGQWQSFRGVPVMPTYHPAYLLRNQSNAIKRQVWEDMLLVMERLGLEITEKQRGYFL